MFQLRTIALSSIALFFIIICGLSYIEVQAQSSSIYSFVGCYEDRHDVRLFDEVKLSTNKSIFWSNPDNCLAECLRIGRIYGGVSGERCFCSDDYPSTIIKTINAECNAQWLKEHPDFAKTPRPRLAVYETGHYANNTYPSKIYLGCYREEPNTAVRILKGPSQQLSSNSPNSCHKFCLKTGFRYFGLTSGDECFCGETPPSENAQVDNEDCNLVCPGDETSKCGDKWIQSVYATGITDIPSFGRYVGCYRNAEDDESFVTEFKITLKNSNSPRRCLNICDQKGYQFAAVQNRDQCLCGNQIPPNGTLDSPSNCNLKKCPGDDIDFCGSRSSLRLFRTRKTDNFGPIEYFGCYETHQENHLLTASKMILPRSLTSSVCIDICKERAYPIAGVMFGKYCHCDYYFGSSISAVDDKECSSPCSGDGHEFCGGPLRYRMYYTGLPRIGTLPATIYKGCFRDDNVNERALKGSWQELDNNSPRICQLLCYRTGYLFFGLTWIKECFCGNENPNFNYLVDETECNKECGGDPSKICGGSWRTNIYSTGLVEISVGDHYLGCYDDSRSKHLLGESMVFLLSNTNSPSKCMSLCDQNGYRFAGIKRGAECYCGNNFYPEQHEKEADENCDTRCPGGSVETCGKLDKMKIYSTTITTAIQYEPIVDDQFTRIDETPGCGHTYSTKNKLKGCKGAILFDEVFDKLNQSLWQPERKIAVGPDYQFVTFTCAPENVGVARGKLYIKPILQPDNFVNGKINISNCTGTKVEECSGQALAYSILPPVASARITTKNSFSFRYGVVDVRARFPLGDWIVGEIMLVPKDNTYGEGYQSGQIRIATVRGNKVLNCDGKELGNKIVEVGVYVGLPSDVRKKTFTKFVNDGWTNAYHNYSLVWTTDNFYFSIDGEQLPPIIDAADDSILKVTDQPSYASLIWNNGLQRLVPFDKEFYISLGVSVGGVRDFPDNCVLGPTGSVQKPWSNDSPKAALNFWRARNEWLKTWKGNSILNVDHVRVTAL